MLLLSNNLNVFLSQKSLLVSIDIQMTNLSAFNAKHLKHGIAALRVTGVIPAWKKYLYYLRVVVLGQAVCVYEFNCTHDSGIIPSVEPSVLGQINLSQRISNNSLSLSTSNERQ